VVHSFALINMQAKSVVPEAEWASLCKIKGSSIIFKKQDFGQKSKCKGKAKKITYLHHYDHGLQFSIISGLRVNGGGRKNSIKLHNNTHLARPKVLQVHCNGAVRTADQQRSVGGSIHTPSFCGLHTELTPTVP